MKILYEKNVFDKEILQASRNVKPPIAKATHKALNILIFVSIKIYQSLDSSILRESHNNHNSRTSSARNTNDLLEPQGLQSYNTNSSWQRGQKN